jgi:predicted DNA-binding transcriptional regulator YafY
MGRKVKPITDTGIVRASQWIREFREQHPNWLVWNSKTRSYHATSEVYQVKNSDARNQEYSALLAKYLALIGIPNAAPGSVHGCKVSSAFPDLSAPHPRIFAVLYDAIRTHHAVQITYRSMREPSPHKRIISPHNLIKAGRRWHVRAFCSTNQDFRDYSLGRIVDAKVLDMPSERLEKGDEAWMAKVSVRLVAHPNLTKEQEEVIRFEYFNSTAARVETCRGALVGYFIQDLRASIDIKNQRPPEYQLAVANVEEVIKWLFPMA